jgi:hypothetical protein
MPAVERKTIAAEYEAEMPVEKWRRPRCAEKELPFLDARERRDGSDCLREWNRIAPKQSYHKRTLEYNEYGVCVDKPFKAFEWRDKTKKSDHVTVAFYLDNGMYYYCYDYWYRDGGSGCGLWIGDPCFPSMPAAKKHAMNYLGKRNKRLAGILKKLLFTPVQGELFREKTK